MSETIFTVNTNPDIYLKYTTSIRNFEYNYIYDCRCNIYELNFPDFNYKDEECF